MNSSTFVFVLLVSIAVVFCAKEYDPADVEFVNKLHEGLENAKRGNKRAMDEYHGFTRRMIQDQNFDAKPDTYFTLNVWIPFPNEVVESGCAREEDCTRIRVVERALKEHPGSSINEVNGWQQIAGHNVGQIQVSFRSTQDALEAMSHETVRQSSPQADPVTDAPRDNPKWTMCDSCVPGRTLSSVRSRYYGPDSVADKWYYDYMDQTGPVGSTESNLDGSNIEQKHFSYAESNGAVGTILHVDSGVYGLHSEFRGYGGTGNSRVSFAPSFFPSGDNTPIIHADEDGHGTKTASLAIGWNIGVSKRAKLYHVKGISTKKIPGNLVYVNSAMIAGINHFSEKVDDGTLKRPLSFTMSIAFYAKYGPPNLVQDPDWFLCYYTNTTTNQVVDCYRSLKAAMNGLVDRGIPVSLAATNFAFDLCAYSQAYSTLNPVLNKWYSPLHQSKRWSTVGSVDWDWDNAIQGLYAGGWPFSIWGEGCIESYAPGALHYAARAGTTGNYSLAAGSSQASPFLAGVKLNYLSATTELNDLENPHEYTREAVKKWSNWQVSTFDWMPNNAEYGDPVRITKAIRTISAIPTDCVNC